MTASDRLFGTSISRWLAVFAAALLALTLLPATSAIGQEPVDDPEDACPEEPPPAPYTDRDEIPEVHVRNVDCVTHRNIALGFADGTYRPALPVPRDQMASFVGRTVEEAGFDLPDGGGEPEFDDIAGNTHEDRINQLARAGIVEGGPEELPPTSYGPRRLVRRDQMASYLMRAAEWALEQDFGESDQRFPDVPPGNVHFENVNGAQERGIALGYADGTYGPRDSTRRDQMASFLSRLLAFLEDPPFPRRVQVSIDPTSGPPGTEVTATVTGDTEDVEAIEISNECVEDQVVFDVDEGDEPDQDGVITFTFTIDEDADEGACVITVTVFFDDGDVEEHEVTFTVTIPDIFMLPSLTDAPELQRVYLQREFATTVRYAFGFDTTVSPDGIDPRMYFLNMWDASRIRGISAVRDDRGVDDGFTAMRNDTIRVVFPKAQPFHHAAVRTHGAVMRRRATEQRRPASPGRSAPALCSLRPSALQAFRSPSMQAFTPAPTCDVKGA
jgi:hypothetical protein